MSDKLKQTIEKLKYLIAIAEHEVIENPLPFLRKAQQQCCELHETISKIERDLSPDCVFDFWENNKHLNIPRAIDIQGEALIRCNKALETINEYKCK